MICAITGCDTNVGENLFKYPLFPLPKNAELQNKWLQNIDSDDINGKLKNGSLICLKHFEDRYINNANKTLNLYENAIPTLNLRKGNTLVDFEELLAQKPPAKKKRGTSGLMNLQIARKKKLMRRKRMQALAEKRRLAKLENKTGSKVTKKKSETMIEPKDYFLGDRVESDSEKLVVSLRLVNLMQHLHNSKMNLCKHPSSIRDAKIYPIFNKIKNITELLDNPINWTKEQVMIFIEHITSQKSLSKCFENEHIDGEAIINLTKDDLKYFLKLDESASEMLGALIQQLRKETIMRYVNS